MSHTQLSVVGYQVSSLGSDSFVRRRFLVRVRCGSPSWQVWHSKYALSSIVYCSKCGEIYWRLVWNSRGNHSIVWRCCTRVEHGPTGCDAPTIQESGLQAVVVQAINIALGNRESMMATLRENVEAVIRRKLKRNLHIVSLPLDVYNVK